MEQKSVKPVTSLWPEVEVSLIFFWKDSYYSVLFNIHYVPGTVPTMFIGLLGFCFCFSGGGSGEGEEVECKSGKIWSPLKELTSSWEGKIHSQFRVKTNNTIKKTKTQKHLFNKYILGACSSSHEEPFASCSLLLSGRLNRVKEQRMTGRYFRRESLSEPLHWSGDLNSMKWIVRAGDL